MFPVLGRESVSTMYLCDTCSLKNNTGPHLHQDLIIHAGTLIHFNNKEQIDMVNAPLEQPTNNITKKDSCGTVTNYYNFIQDNKIPNSVTNAQLEYSFFDNIDEFRPAYSESTIRDFWFEIGATALTDPRFIPSCIAYISRQIGENNRFKQLIMNIDCWSKLMALYNLVPSLLLQQARDVPTESSDYRHFRKSFSPYLLSVQSHLFHEHLVVESRSGVHEECALFSRNDFSSLESGRLCYQRIQRKD